MKPPARYRMFRRPWLARVPDEILLTAVGAVVMGAMFLMLGRIQVMVQTLDPVTGAPVHADPAWWKWRWWILGGWTVISPVLIRLGIYPRILDFARDDEDQPS